MSITTNPTFGGKSRPYMGKWTQEEEEYVIELVDNFKAGNLENVTNGTSLRKHMAERLQCSPKRVSKKYEDTAYNGRHKYLHNHTIFSSKEALKRRNRLEDLRVAFLRSRDDLLRGIISLKADTVAVNSASPQQGRKVVHQQSNIGMDAIAAMATARRDKFGKVKAEDKFKKAAAKGMAAESRLPTTPTSITSGGMAQSRILPNNIASLDQLTQFLRHGAATGTGTPLEVPSRSYWGAPAAQSTVGSATLFAAGNNPASFMTDNSTDLLVRAASIRASAGNNNGSTSPLSSSTPPPMSHSTTAAFLAAAAQLQEERRRAIELAFSNGNTLQTSNPSSLQGLRNLLQYR